MKLKLALFGVVFALLLGALLGANNRRKQTPTYLLSQYPQTTNLYNVTQKHSQSNPWDLIRSDWFTNSNTSTEISTGCKVDQDGMSKCQNNWSTGSDRYVYGKVGSSQIAAFDKLAPTLPPSAATAPTLANLLVVSFRQNGSWTTRIYDRSNLPPVVVRAHRLLGIKGFEESGEARSPQR